MVYDITKRCTKLISRGVDRLLDVGSAEGDNTKFYLNKARRTFALDFNPTFISKGKRRLSSINFVVAKSEHLPFKHNSFSVVTLTEVLEHISDEQKTIDEIYRVLKPNGRLILSVPHKGLFAFLDPDNFKFYFPKIYVFFYKLIKKREPQKSSRFSKDIDFHKHYSLNEIKKMFDKKFHIGSVYQKGFLLFPVSIWLRYFLSITRLKKTILMSLVKVIGDIDFSVSYGGLSYSLIILGIKNNQH